MTRRTLLAAAVTPAALRARESWPERLGIMCQLSGAEPQPRKVLAAARAAGFVDIQVNFPWDKVDAPFLNELPGWIRAEGLRCRAVGAYVNCLRPETVIMNTRRDDFPKALDYAARLGATHAVAWTGGWLPDLMKADRRNYAPEAHDAILGFLDPYLKRLEQNRLTLALESYITLACPDAPSLRRLLDRLPKTVGAVLDPPNLTPPSRYEDRDQVLREMFETLAGRIVLVHCKDFRLRPGGAYDLPGPLLGAMNYRRFRKAIESLPDGIPVIAEHLDPGQFAEARRRLLAVEPE